MGYRQGKMRRTATTANAILGLLALRAEWSTWELTREMRRNLRFFWPRAESRVYDELRRLHEAGAVEARHEHTGRRQRTIWAITENGRERLAHWLATPPRGAYSENEPVLRLLVGNLGDPALLDSAIERLRADALELAHVAHGIADAYRAGTAPFQQHVENRALVFTYLATQAAATLQWAEAADRYLDQLADADPDTRTRAALAAIERARAFLPPEPAAAQADSPTPQARGR